MRFSQWLRLPIGRHLRASSRSRPRYNASIQFQTLENRELLTVVSDMTTATGTAGNDNTSGTVKDLQAGSPNTLYVTGVYHDVLGRAPDSGGLTYWDSLLNQGMAISSVAEAIAHSAE